MFGFVGFGSRRWSGMKQLLAGAGAVHGIRGVSTVHAGDFLRPSFEITLTEFADAGAVDLDSSGSVHRRGAWMVAGESCAMTQVRGFNSGAPQGAFRVDPDCRPDGGKLQVFHSPNEYANRHLQRTEQTERKQTGEQPEASGKNAPNHDARRSGFHRRRRFQRNQPPPESAAGHRMRISPFGRPQSKAGPK